MASHLDFEGTFDPKRRFLFTNWSTEDFTHTIDSEPITIKAGDVREFGHFEAFLLTKHFVDRQMGRVADNEASREMRERLTMAINNADARKPFEDKTLTEIVAGEKSPLEAMLEVRIRRELQAEMANSSINQEFEELESAEEPEIEDVLVAALEVENVEKPVAKVVPVKAPAKKAAAKRLAKKA